MEPLDFAYAVQNASDVRVRGARHVFGDPGATTGSIHLLIPSEWWIPGAPVHDVP